MDADFLTRRDCLIFICPRRDSTQNSGRDPEAWCLFLRDRDKNKLLIKKKTVNLAKFCLKSTHPDQDETETRLRKIEANETRLSQTFSSETRPRREKIQNFAQDREYRYLKS